MDNIKGFLVEFDFSSAGFWGTFSVEKPVSNLELGGTDYVSKDLMHLLDRWNCFFDTVLTYHNRDNESNNYYVVPKVVAEMMKPVGMWLAKEAKKQIPDMPVWYTHYYEDEGRYREHIEIK